MLNLELAREDKLKNLRADTFWIFYDMLDDFATLQLECDLESEITKEKLSNLATKFRKQDALYVSSANRIECDEGVTPNA